MVKKIHILYIYIYTYFLKIILIRYNGLRKGEGAELQVKLCPLSKRKIIIMRLIKKKKTQGCFSERDRGTITLGNDETHM